MIYMEKTNYIVAIELTSSKISGVVGIDTYEGTRIIAAESIPVSGIISKGVVRNVDKASEAISNLINLLDDQLNGPAIKKAYISFAGLSVHGITSKVSRGFGEYVKITQDIIEDMECENCDTFQAPEGFERLQVIPQECRLDGKIDNNPIGAHAKLVECNYLNIVVKRQFYKQLCESMAQAGIEIADISSAAIFDTERMLTDDQRRNGCALVNIGAETTTISIYKNNKPRMLTVLPLGSNNITLDLTAERISYDVAEDLKIARGYKSAHNERDILNSETVSNVIYARMSEILQNVKYQIEESGEVNHIVFRSGGSRLNNLGMLLEEFLSNFSTEIRSDWQCDIQADRNVNAEGIVTTVLCGLLNMGKENCCEQEIIEVNENGMIFGDDEMTGNNTKEEDIKPAKVKEHEKPTTKGGKKSGLNIGSLFKQLLDNITSEEEYKEEEEQ